MATAQDRLNQILPSWYDLLTQWSLDGPLVAAATDALMLESSNAKQDAKGQLQSYVSQWSAGNFSLLPKIVLLSAADISGVYGAYANSTDTIYLNQDWLLTATEEEIQKVLTEELGHYLDDQLNKADTRGDEGEFFSNILFGQPYNSTDLDAGTISVNGIQTEAEFAALSSTPAWVKEFGSSNYEDSYGTAVASDGKIWTVTAGRYLLDGQTKTNDADNYITIFNPDSTVSTTIYAGPITSQIIQGISSTGDRVYVGGQTTAGTLDGQTNSWGKTGYLTAYDNAGTKLWTRLLPGYTGTRCITSDSSGIYAAGFTYFGLNGQPSLGGADAFIAKFSTTGTLLWTRTIGGSGDNANGGTNQVSGNGSYVAVAGYTNQSIDGQPQTSGGFVSFFTASGTKLWTRMRTEGIGPIYVAPDNSVYISGGKSGTTDFYVTKLDSSGNQVWTNTFGTSGNDYSRQLSINSDGELVVLAATTGAFTGFTNAGNYDHAFLRINTATGSFIGASQWGSSGLDSGAQLATSSDGTVYLSGTTNYSLPGNSFQGGSADAYLIRFNKSITNSGQAVFGIAGATNAAAPAVTENLIASVVTADPDGNGSGFTYTWESYNGSSWDTIGTGSGYTVKAADEGKQVRLRVNYTDGQGFSEQVVTTAGTVAAYNNGQAVFGIAGATNAAAPAVTENLIASVVTADPDGNGSGFTYTWESYNGSSWDTIGTGSGYTVKAADEGKQVRLRVNYTDGQGFSEQVVTTAGTVAAYNNGQAVFGIAGATNAAAPAVTENLIASVVTADPDGNGSGFTYTWESYNGSSWDTIGTGSGYTVKAADEGKQVRLRVNYTDGQGFSEQVVTTAGTVAAYNNGQAVFGIAGATNAAAPAVTENLIASVVTADPDGNGSGFTYTWESYNGSSWDTIGTGSGYTVKAADEGKQVRLRVNYTDGQGFSEQVVTTAGTVAAYNNGQAVFRINGNGTATESQNLTCILDSLDPDGMAKLPPSKTGDLANGYTYQWEVSSDGLIWSSAIGTGANTFKYAVNLTSDSNKFLRVRVDYADDNGFVQTVLTDSVKIVSGSNKNDNFSGTSGVEVTFSGSGADAVATGAGNDFAKGGVGNDTFNGVDLDGDDFFDGQTEIDTLNYSASTKGVTIDFVTGVVTERAVGGAGRDTFAFIENARGSSVADIFAGNSGVNVFTGGGGADTYRFMNQQTFGASTSDRIVDFSADDKIEISAAAFGVVGKTLSYASVTGTRTATAASLADKSSALFVYDTGTGQLYINRDGATAGVSGQSGVFAVLDNKFTGLAVSNFGWAL